MTTSRGLEAHATALRQAVHDALAETLTATDIELTDDDRTALAECLVAATKPEADLVARLGDRSLLRLVAFDADRIQEWVFASERIQVARGASATLENVDRQALETLLANDDLRAVGLRGVVYAAGGGGLVIATPTAPIADQERILREALETTVNPKASGPRLTFTCAAVDVTGVMLETSKPRPLEDTGAGRLDRYRIVDGFSGVFARLRIALREKKDSGLGAFEAASEFVPLDGRALDRCPSCYRVPAGTTRIRADEASWCDRCVELRKRDRSSSTSAGNKDKNPENSATTFVDVAESDRGRGYLAYLAADGDDFGHRFESLRSLDQVMAFSVVVTDVFAAARADVAKFVERHTKKQSASASLLSGGDEIVFVLPADVAPAAAIVLTHAVERRLRALPGPDDKSFPGPVAKALRSATISTGLVIAPPTYPVALMRRDAAQLQRQAKRSPADRGPKPSTIAWTFLTDGAPRPTASGDHHVRLGETSVAAFEHKLAEVTLAMTLPRTKEEARRNLIGPDVPKSVLRPIVALAEREERAGLDAHGTATSTLPPTARRTVDRVVAGFFRYQLARSPELRRWWDQPAVRGRRPAHAVEEWLGTGGRQRLASLLDWLSLAPIAGPATSPEGRRLEGKKREKPKPRKTRQPTAKKTVEPKTPAISDDATKDVVEAATSDAIDAPVASPSSPDSPPTEPTAS